MMNWSSTHVLFWNHWTTCCAGGHPNGHFRCCHCRDSNPNRVNANNKCQHLKDSVIPPCYYIYSILRLHLIICLFLLSNLTLRNGTKEYN